MAQKFIAEVTISYGVELWQWQYSAAILDLLFVR
jgi:hypothetical protein